MNRLQTWKGQNQAGMYGCDFSDKIPTILSKFFRGKQVTDCNGKGEDVSDYVEIKQLILDHSHDDVSP